MNCMRWLRRFVLPTCVAGLLGCVQLPERQAHPSVSDLVCSRLRIGCVDGRAASWRQYEFSYFDETRSFPCVLVGESVIGCDGEELSLEKIDLTPVSRGEHWVMRWIEPHEASALRYIELSDEGRDFVLEQWAQTDWRRPGAVEFIEAEMLRLEYQLPDLSFSWYVANQVADLLLASAVLTGDVSLAACAREASESLKLSLALEDKQRRCTERATAIVLMEVNGIGFGIPSSDMVPGRYCPSYWGLKKSELVVLMEHWDSRAYTRSRSVTTGLLSLRLGERVRLVAAHLMLVESCSKEEFALWLKQ